MSYNNNIIVVVFILTSDYTISIICLVFNCSIDKPNRFRFMMMPAITRDGNDQPIDQGKKKYTKEIMTTINYKP